MNSYELTLTLCFMAIVVLMGGAGLWCKITLERDERRAAAIQPS
jgi:hypothetical protein